MIDWVKHMKVGSLLVFCAVFVAAQVQPPMPPDTVVATVAGQNVTIDDVRHMLENAPAQFTQMFQNSPQMAIQQYFMMRFLAREAERLKLADQSPLKEQLELMRENFLAGAMFNHERDSFPVSAQEIDSFYEKNKSRWEQAKIKAIFIAFKPGVTVSSSAATSAGDIAAAARSAFEGAHPANQRSEEEARKLAADLVKQLREGADFVKLVEQYSDDSSSRGSQGDFGTVKASSAYPDDLKKAIFALQPGELSDPVRQPTGFYIIRMEEKSFEPENDVRETIIQEIRQAHLGDKMNEWTARFQPTVKNTEFFLHPKDFIVGKAGTSAAPPAPAAQKP